MNFWVRLCGCVAEILKALALLYPRVKSIKSISLIDDNQYLYILLDGLVCSIVGYFYESRCIFASQNARDELKYPTILHTKPSNKGFIIQLNCKMEKWSAYKLSELRVKLT